MNKKVIIDYLAKNAKYTEEQKELIKAIEEAREEMERARLYFESVSEPKLVDHAIHLEDAAKTKFVYLLSQAKNSGIKTDFGFMLDEIEAI